MCWVFHSKEENVAVREEEQSRKWVREVMKETIKQVLESHCKDLGFTTRKMKSYDRYWAKYPPWRPVCLYSHLTFKLSLFCCHTYVLVINKWHIYILTWFLFNIKMPTILVLISGLIDIVSLSIICLVIDSTISDIIYLYKWQGQLLLTSLYFQKQPGY